MIRAGIIGASGYTGGELTRILLNHPSVEIGCLYSNTHKGKKVSDVHRDLTGETDLVFINTVDTANLDVLFLCLPHGKSREFLDSISIRTGLKIIDLSQDFRLSGKNTFNGGAFTYGLPEAFRQQIKSSEYIANPGCFATAIQLALLPLASAGLMKNAVHVNATTGSTGAGTELVKTTGYT
jgi:N-acetyl-gamma-glutamyl-phosphate reductase